MRLIVVAALLVAGCVPSSEATITTSIREGQRAAVGASGLEVAIHDQTLALEVYAGRDGPLVVEGPAIGGASYATPIGGRHCNLSVQGVFADSEPGLSSKRTRTFREVQVTASCADGPAPGSPAAAFAARAFVVLGWALPFLVLGLLVGATWDQRSSNELTRRQLAGIGLLLVGAIGAIVTAIVAFDGLFVATASALFVGYGVIGIGGGILARKDRGDRIVGIGLVAGALGGGSAIALAIPRWAWGAPLLAIGAAAAAGLVVFAIANAVVAERKT